MDNTVLRQLQLTQLEMLRFVDEICRKNSISYSLYAGTLLGAVRHQGFIPWDDDLDICMSRENYNSFLSIWQQVDHSGYSLQNKENTPSFTQSFTKIRKDNTTFLHNEDEAGKYHTGIFIDIFPIDRIPEGKLSRVFYWWNCMKYQLYTREFVPQENGAVAKIVSSILLKLVSPSRRPSKRQKLLKRITSYNSNHSLETVAIETVSSMKKPFSADMLDEYTELQFEDQKYQCFSGWDDHLKRKFGSYMQLPPVEERTWKHHPVVIDFNSELEVKS